MVDRVRDAVPVVPDLPNEVRHQEKDGDAEADPRPGASQLPSGPGRQESDEHGDAEPDHGVLRLQADAEHESQQQPLSRVRSAQQPDEQQARDCPDELVEADRLKEDIGANEHGRDQHGQRREHLRQRIAAQLSRDQCRDDDDRGAGEDRQQAQGRERTREDGLVEPRQQRRDRRIVDVPEGGMPARGQVVELIPVPPVAIGDGHRHAHLGSDQ